MCSIVCKNGKKNNNGNSAQIIIIKRTQSLMSLSCEKSSSLIVITFD